MSHGRQPEVECYLFWRGFAPLPWTGKLLFFYLLLDVTNAMASKRSKKEKIQLPVHVRGSKTSVLKFPISSQERLMYLEMVHSFWQVLKLSEEIFHLRFVWKIILQIYCEIFIPSLRPSYIINSHE